MQKKKIRILTDETINQIAAGEVVENPASVVKELFENSIDAGAKKITVEIKGGGHFLIRIVDDGCGMGRDDAVLAFERHATSKIVSVDDLMKLSSMGFRGEALASIAAVSKVELETSENGEVGTRVVCHGGRMMKVEACSRKVGTTIEISSLFYNIPARKKFQKSATASTSEIVKMAVKLALAHPEVEFRLISQEKEMVTAPEQNRIAQDRIAEVLGKNFADGARKVEFQESGHRIHGIVGAPEAARQNRSGQYLFINSRPIHSPLISGAVQTAFGTRIGSKMHPVFVLWLEMPADMLDVNVHPQKREVRFREEEMIVHLFEKAVNSSFAPMPKITFELPKVERPARSFAEPKAIYAPTPVPVQKGEPETRQVVLMHDQIAFVKDENEDLHLVDLQQVYARIQFHQVMKRLREEKESPLQRLLFPETLEFAPVEAKTIEMHLELLKKIGFDMRPFGKSCFMVEAISPLFSIDQCKELLDKLIGEFRGGR